MSRTRIRRRDFLKTVVAAAAAGTAAPSLRGMAPSAGQTVPGRERPL